MVHPYALTHSIALIGRLGAQHNFRAEASQTKVATERLLLIIPAVTRRIHVPTVFLGEIPLDPAQARHARDVLRLEAGTVVEVFDNAGTVANGELIFEGQDVSVRVDVISTSAAETGSFQCTIAAAVPKGDRADWMVEKLSELGVSTFIPLAADRSVVLPEGRNKRERWARLATESAKQCRRAGVMRIGELTRVDAFLASLAPTADSAGWYFSTAPDAQPAGQAVLALPPIRSLTALIGPEGGWTDPEVAHFTTATLTPIQLTQTVLRIETAAVAAAALIGTLVAPGKGKS